MASPSDAARGVAEDYADKYVSRVHPEWDHLVSDFLSFRREALEEAAKVADAAYKSQDQVDRSPHRIAAAIRKLAEDG